MKKIRAVFFVLSFYFLSFLQASAHVKWFVDSEEVTENYHGLFPFYTLESREVWIWSVLLVVWIFLFGLLNKYLKAPKGLVAFGEKYEKQINRVAQAVMGVFLITVSFVWKIIIVPEIGVGNLPTVILSFIQAAVGLMFILNFYPRVASVLLVAFCLGIGVFVGPVAFAENFILLSLAFYFLIKNSKTGFFSTYDSYALPMVRVGTGLSLIILAFTEKLLYPELSIMFLNEHSWNFFFPIFPWFTNNLFILSAGFVEIGFGVLFVLGFLTRINTVMIAAFFACSVVTMLIQTGKWEVEDLVVYAAAILFVFFGSGSFKKVTKIN